MADRNAPGAQQRPGGPRDTSGAGDGSGPRVNKDGETLHPYEVLDSGMGDGARLHRFGDKVWLTEERAEELEPFGSVRPWGVDDHDLVDDERDLAHILASAGGRERLARDRAAKRAGARPAKTTAPPEPMDKDTKPDTDNAGGRRE